MTFVDNVLFMEEISKSLNKEEDFIILAVSKFFMCYEEIDIIEQFSDLHYKIFYSILKAIKDKENIISDHIIVIMYIIYIHCIDDNHITTTGHNIYALDVMSLNYFNEFTLKFNSIIYSYIHGIFVNDGNINNGYCGRDILLKEIIITI